MYVAYQSNYFQVMSELESLLARKYFSFKRDNQRPIKIVPSTNPFEEVGTFTIENIKKFLI